MAAYLCSVGTPDGEVVEERLEGISEVAVREELGRRGYHVFSVRAAGGAMALFGRDEHGRSGRIKMQEFLVFNQQLMALVRAGLPILQAFEILLERMEKGTLRAVLVEVRDDVKSGVAISDAFERHGTLFPRIYSTSLRAGERSGDLEGVLKRFLDYQRILIAVRKKVVGAMIYPVVLLTLSLALITIMLTYVIPKFTVFYADFKASLPLPTMILVKVSDFARHTFWMWVGGGIVGGLALSRWMRTPRGRLLRDRFLLGVPFIGGIFLKFSIAQFTKSLATLIGGGTPLVPAMEIAAGSVGNADVSQRLSAVVQNVREGGSLWGALDESGVMTSLVIEMIKVGESTGALEEMLDNISQFFDEEIDTSLQRVVTLVEPLMLVFMGLVIAGLLVAVYLPLFSLVGQLN